MFKRLSVIVIMLICMIASGCGKEVKEEKVEKEVEKEADEVSLTPIDCLVVSKYTDKEIIVYSDTSCCFYLDIDITDGDYKGHHNKLFEISSGETLKLTINDIFSDFYSDEAIIDSVYYHGHAYSYCSESKTHKTILDDCEILVKSSNNEIQLLSDKNCFVDLFVSIDDNNYSSSNEYKSVKLKASEPLTINVNTLAPGFFSNSAEFRYVNPYFSPYIIEE